MPDGTLLGDVILISRDDDGKQRLWHGFIREVRIDSHVGSAIDTTISFASLNEIAEVPLHEKDRS